MKTVTCLLRHLFCPLLLTAGVLQAVSDDGKGKGCPFVKIVPERLPDLNIPRFGNNIFYINGELTVIGGHTSGFVPTATAEYFADGQWHQLQTVYPHDAGCAIVLKSGKVLLAGGFEQPLGIGQTFPVEMYDPVSHAFDGFGCLDKKRTMFSGLELDNGTVILSGNWYHDDGIELLDGIDTFTHLKDVSQQRAFPYIFQIAPDDAIIFGSTDNHGHTHDSIVIDRLKGDSFTTPLFNEWKPFYVALAKRWDDSFIGNKAQGYYAYLFTVTNNDGQLAIAKAEGTEFSLLPTTCPIPMQSQWGAISYYAQVLIDRESQRGYILGTDKDHPGACHQYILCIDYGQASDGRPCPITLYYTDPIPDLGDSTPVLTPEGNLILAGGKTHSNASGNFRPVSHVLLFRFGRQDTAATQPGLWLWASGILAVILLMGMLANLFIYRQRNNRQTAMQPTAISDEMGENTDDSILMQRLLQLMDEQKPYLNSELKVADIAQELGASSRSISDSIKAARNCNFSDFINNYRIEYAKHLLRDNPDMKLSEIYLRSGFASEATFFRIFKAATGITPTEWRNKIDSHNLQ